MTTIYIDVLFGLNFIINYLLLLVTAKLSRVNPKRLRLVCGAAFGALYAAAVFFPSMSFLTTVLAKISATILMVLISFGKNTLAKTVRLIFMLILCSLVLAGGMMLAYYSFGGFIDIRNGVPYIPLSLKTILFSAVLCYMLTGIVFRGFGAKKDGKHIFNLSVTMDGRTVSFDTLADTGCNVSDPISGKKVIVCGLDALCFLFSDSEWKIISQYAVKDPAVCIEKLAATAHANCFRVVPFRTVNKSAGLMLVLKPDEITDEKHRKLDALIGISIADMPQEQGFSALMGVNY